MRNVSLPLSVYHHRKKNADLRSEGAAFVNKLKNTLLSILGGSILYLLLVNFIF